jgi:hypothetical protein
MTFTSLDILYMALTLLVVSITIPLSMILWRAFFMMDRVQRILRFVDHVVNYGEEVEKKLIGFIEKFLK